MQKPAVLKHLLVRFGFGGTFFNEQPLVARSRLRALATQLPLLFVILFVNIAALAATHVGVAPAWLTIGLPAVALPLFVIRYVGWRRLDTDSLTDAQVARRLRASMVLATGIGLAMVTWAIALMPYGGVFARAHIAFFLAVSGIGCLIGLIHMRYGAVLVAAILTIPTVVVFLMSGERTFIVIAMAYMVVTPVMCVIALSHYNAFRRLVEATRDLGHLSDANRQLAEIDSLTSLANRRSFLAEVETMVEIEGMAAGSFVIGLIDLDGFKPINDLYGHQAGDRVLAEVGRRLGSKLEGLCSVARLGGDEFAFLIPSAADERQIERVGQRVCEIVAEPFDLPAGRIRIGASIGMAMFPATARTLDHLMERADFALYYAKEQARGTAIMFTDEHERRIRERGKLEHELRRADLDAELSLVFQPLVDTHFARVICFEALARWTNAALGDVSPSLFIPAAERIGIITEISETLFRKACVAAADWPDHIRLAFNLSTGDLAAADAKERLCRMVRDSGLAPTRITFEITETSVMRDFAHSVTVLAALRELGCRIALDDFGTGFSSLSYVHRLPLDKLKVDQSFVRALATDGISFAIVRTIVDLCANLDISCVIEGVETQEQADLLASIGCSVMQGYLFGKPMPAAVIAAGGAGPWSRRARNGGLAAAAMDRAST